MERLICQLEQYATELLAVLHGMQVIQLMQLSDDRTSSLKAEVKRLLDLCLEARNNGEDGTNRSGCKVKGVVLVIGSRTRTG
ncbi:hypothetical protein CDL15_Pgr029193 [Punica granatum]|uniref:Uncharacterized protein n=1 Tax=Punica granatum TaxID=22663 RepID=A0A218XES1_PUNGR|nr:hypothetical protein CDL15_Pgr029193 [Punica granatum]